MNPELDIDTYELRVRWSRPVAPDVAGRALENLIRLALELHEPCDVSFVVEAGGNSEPKAAICVRAIDGEHARHAAELLRHAALGLVPFVGFSEPEPHRRRPPSFDEPEWSLDVLPGVGRSTLHTVSPPWRVAVDARHRTEMSVELVSIDTEPLDDTPTVECRVSLRGHPSMVPIVAAMIAEETPSQQRIIARLGAPRRVTVPLPVVAHLASTSARMPGVWPPTPRTATDRLTRAMLESTPPHSVIFGGSGQGKTTFLEHVVRAALAVDHVSMSLPPADRHVVAVLCPTGDAGGGGAELQPTRALPFEAIDFGDTEMPPRFNVCQAPAWVTPQEHVGDLLEVIAASWDGELTSMMFGPVGRLYLRSVLAPVVLDPAGAWPITDAVPVFTRDSIPEHIEEALQRIGSDEVRDALRRARLAAKNDRDHQLGPWVISKLEPLVGSARVRRIVDHRHSSVDLGRLATGVSLIVSAPASILGEEGSSVLLGLLLGHIHQLARVLDPAERPRVTIVIDEAHRFPRAILRTMLAESRKFGVILATQGPTSLDSATLSAVLSNCGTVATFRIGADDAQVLSRQFPRVRAQDLTQLASRVMAVSQGDEDYICEGGGPIVDPNDREALTDAHRASAHHPSKPSITLWYCRV
jgi:hypothetical protein